MHNSVILRASVSKHLRALFDRLDRHAGTIDTILQESTKCCTADRTGVFFDSTPSSK